MTRGLEQVERPVRVHAEVRLRIARRPVVRRLRGGVDDELEILSVLREDPVDALGVADVELDPAELVAVAFDEPLADRAGRGVGPEELRAHVVLEPDDVEPLLDEVLDGFGTDEPARAGDDRSSHPVRPYPRARSTARSCSLIQRKIASRICRGRLLRPPVGMPV